MSSKYPWRPVRGDWVKITRQWVGEILDVDGDLVLIETNEGRVAWVPLELANGTTATVERIPND